MDVERSACNADDIARCAHRAYAALPKKGKPQAHEWTVLAAIVITTAAKTALPRCVAVTTGTKCVGLRDMSVHGDVVNDSHAEVLVRRVLKLQLLSEIHQHCVQCFSAEPARSAAACALASDCLLHHTMDDGGVPRFKLRDDFRMWLYISDSPCGSAAEYEDSSPDSSAGVSSRRSGAKAVAVDATPPEMRAPSSSGAEKAEAQPDALRTKSGRSDLPAERRTRSMCCSDKVARWLSVPGGWAGSLLTHALGTRDTTVHVHQSPLPLHGIVVSAGEGAPSRVHTSLPVSGIDAQLHTLHRVLWTRAALARSAAYERAFGADTGECASEECASERQLTMPVLCTTQLVFSDGRVSKASSLGVHQPYATGAGGKRKRDGGGEEAQAPAAILVPSGMCILAWDERLYNGGSGGGGGRPAWVTHALEGARGKRCGAGTGKGAGREDGPDWKAAAPVCKGRLFAASEQALAAIRKVATQPVSPLPSPAMVSASLACAGSHATYHEAKTCQACPAVAAYRSAMNAFHTPGLGFESWLRNDKSGEDGCTGPVSACGPGHAC